MSVYVKDPITNKEIYKVDASGREHTINGIYAKDENGNDYYPLYEPGKYLVVRQQFHPLFIPNTVSFSNINSLLEIDSVKYYSVLPNQLGSMYLRVMQDVTRPIYAPMYDAWKKAGLLAEPFKHYKNYSRFKQDAIPVYYRNQNDYFIFEGDKEVTVVFDTKGRLHKQETLGVYYENGMTYHLEDQIHKKYFEQQWGIIANWPDKVYYTPYPPTPTITIGNSQFTVGKFGQDVDQHGLVFNYTPDYKFQYDSGIIRRFQFGYRWDARYYEDANGNYNLPDDEPANVDPDADYEKDQTGKELYPKFKENEYCHAERSYAKNADGSFYYPQLADGRLLILQSSSLTPIFVPGGGVDLKDLDHSVYRFVRQRYFVTKNPMQQPLSVVEPNILHLVQPNVLSIIQPNVLPQVQPNVLPQVQPNVQPIPQVQPKVQPNILPNAQPNVLPNVQPNIQPNVQPNIQPNVQPNIQPKVQPIPQVQPKVQPIPQVQPKVQPIPQVQPNVQPIPQVQPNVQPIPQVQPNVQPIPQVQPIINSQSPPQSNVLPVVQPKPNVFNIGPSTSAAIQQSNANNKQKLNLPSSNKFQSTKSKFDFFRVYWLRILCFLILLVIIFIIVFI